MANLIPNLARDPKIEKLIARAVSPGDGRGFVYVFGARCRSKGPGVGSPRRRAPAAYIRQRGGRARYKVDYKIGRTKNIVRRKGEWRRQCGPGQNWMMCWDVPFAAKMVGNIWSEAIIHLHYKRIKPAWITPVPCAECGIKHREKFCLRTIGRVESIDRVISHYCARLGWMYTRTRVTCKMGVKTSRNEVDPYHSQYGPHPEMSSIQETYAAALYSVPTGSGVNNCCGVEGQSSTLWRKYWAAYNERATIGMWIRQKAPRNEGAPTRQHRSSYEKCQLSLENNAGYRQKVSVRTRRATTQRSIPVSRIKHVLTNVNRKADEFTAVVF
ncbi:hypothetical protein B0H10DRAFT_1950980 [Mycena sp. CBHHK59/15]|nr:hypothetical protein B0H10DRAFT_1950980 [Mycena sp. CBHHK59/15]